MGDMFDKGKFRIVLVMIIMLIISVLNTLVTYYLSKDDDMIYLITRSLVIVSLCILTYIGYNWAKILIEWLIAIPMIIFFLGITHIFFNFLEGIMSIAFIVAYGYCSFLLATDEVSSYIEYKSRLRHKSK